LPIFVVQISQSSQINNLKKIKYLFHQLIYWDKLKRRDVIQCKKCQRIGHTASNCNLPYRCVKCGDKHDPGRCGCLPGTRLDRKKIFCVNCGEYGHPASYKGCPKIIENRNKLNNLRNANNNKKIKRHEDKINTNNAAIQPGISYAQITKKYSIDKNENTSNFKTGTQNYSAKENTKDKNFTISIDKEITEIKNNINRLEKIIESNATKINTVASLLEKLINLNG